MQPNNLPKLESTVTVMGVDPGFASMGVAILEKPTTGPIAVRMARVLESKKAPKETLRLIRVASDDQRRLREFWVELHEIMEEYKPRALAIEQWRPFPGQMGGNAWKVGQACQVAQCVAWQREMSQFSFLPSDIKRRFLGKQAGDKNRVGYAILQAVEGLAPMLFSMAKGKHEHVYDAVGLAYLALEELERIKSL